MSDENKFQPGDKVFIYEYGNVTEYTFVAIEQLTYGRQRFVVSYTDYRGLVQQYALYTADLDGRPRKFLTQAEHDAAQAARPAAEAEALKFAQEAAEALGKAQEAAQKAGLDLKDLYKASRVFLDAMDGAGWNTSSFDC